MPKKINLLNQKFGKLIVIDTAPNLKNGLTAWKCQCECGNECIVATKYLRNGDTKSCGCKLKENDPTTWLQSKWDKQVADSIGKKFNKLTILSRYKKDNEWYAHCKCDCGKEKDIRFAAVSGGQIKSCGCLQSEHMRKLGYSKALDLKGEKYGLLTPLYRIDKANGSDTIWHCKCDCGNFIDVKTELLRNFHVSSCGCLNSSKGELIISQILNDNNIIYIKEKTFKDCYFNNKNHLARFDFYIPTKNYLIEYDGEQHFKYNNSLNYWNTKENFKKIQKHDKIKNEYCFKNNIPLIRIPYYYLNNLKIEDLLLETSNFILKEREPINE